MWYTGHLCGGHLTVNADVINNIIVKIIKNMCNSILPLVLVHASTGACAAVQHSRQGAVSPQLHSQEDPGLSPEQQLSTEGCPQNAHEAAV